jgi:hypothetical protein
METNNFQQKIFDELKVYFEPFNNLYTTAEVLDFFWLAGLGYSYYLQWQCYLRSRGHSVRDLQPNFDSFP